MRESESARSTLEVKVLELASANKNHFDDVELMRSAQVQSQHTNGELESHVGELTSAAEEAACHMLQLQQRLEETDQQLSSQNSNHEEDQEEVEALRCQTIHLIGS